MFYLTFRSGAGRHEKGQLKAARNRGKELAYLVAEHETVAEVVDDDRF